MGRSNSAPRTLFFADAGPSVGGGHVMRCLTLARALVERGGVCAFAAPPDAAALLDAFAGAEIEPIAVAPGDVDGLARQVASAARDWSANAVVIDHYGFGPEAEARMTGAAKVFMVMDDLRRAHACDLVVDSNLGRGAGDYPGCEALTGPAFALVRPEFAALREAALARRALGDAPRRLLVSLGLTDVGGITVRVAQALAPGLSLDIVLGAGAPSLAPLRALAGRDGRVSLHVDTKDMARLTAAADLAIGAGGSSVWERSCLGLPSLTLVLADNQRANAEALAAAGATLMVEAGEAGFEDELRGAVFRLIADAAMRQAMSQAAAALCDGGGAARVAARLLALIAA